MTYTANYAKTLTEESASGAKPFLRKMIIAFLCMISAICVILARIYALSDVPLLKFFMIMYAVQHIIWLLVFIFYKEMQIESIIPIYLAYIIVILYPVVSICWNSGYSFVFFWYILIPFGAITFQVKKIFLWLFLIAATIISVFFFCPVSFSLDFDHLLVYRITITTIISVSVMSAFFIIMILKKNKIEDAANAEKLRALAENNENIEKNKILYKNIIEYLEKNKPFKNPDFNANTLAKALNSNENYISKAINTGTEGKANFKSLITDFRINYVKSMLDKGALEKYSIDHIYNEAGYKYRSTFNSAFKSITGMTPTEYVSNQNLSDN